MAPTIGVNLRVTGHCHQGGRKYMEDMFSVAYQHTPDELDLEYAYFGIFDGHGGHEAATFAKEHLMKQIVSQPGFWSENDEDVLRAIKDGFIATHYLMWTNLENWPKTASGLPSTSGTTASIAFIRKSNIYIGHVGDSCIVLGYKEPNQDAWCGVALTEDHKPESPSEHERIRQAGGQVITKAGVPRVVWHRPRLAHQGPMTRSTHIEQIPFLAVARSLGDLWSYNPDSDRFVVSPEPDVFVHHINQVTDKCLIFGTDGLWNMLSPSKAVSIVEFVEKNNKKNSSLKQEHVWMNPSKCLVDNAISKWMSSKLRADNTSAVTLLLDPLGPPTPAHFADCVENNTQLLETDFVPYVVESYKMHDGKSPNKPLNQTNGLAVCTWLPRRSKAEPFDKLNTGMTTLKTMEALYGDTEPRNNNKVTEEETPDDNQPVDDENENHVTPPSETSQEVDNENNTNHVLPQTSVVADRQTDHRTTITPLSYASVVKSTQKPSDTEKTVCETQISRDLSMIQINEVSSSDDDKLESEDEWVKKSRDSIVSLPIDMTETLSDSKYGMKLRGSLQSEPENDITAPKNYQKETLHTKQIKRNGKRGRKRKSGDKLTLEDEKIGLRSMNKRRHSSLVESVNLSYEPGQKRRTRSEDQRKIYEEEYKSDTENENVKSEIKEEKVKLKQKKDLEKGHCSYLSVLEDKQKKQDAVTSMRLRSCISVKTLRSRNINLENVDNCLLEKINTTRRINTKSEELTNISQKQLTNLARTSLLVKHTTRVFESQRTVHTRSQNKKFKK